MTPIAERGGETTVVVGGGVFGAAAAVELRARGHRVVLLDPGPLPHPRASSTDVSKAVRSDYGDDGTLTDLALEALAGWRRWNAEWAEPPYREVGFLAWSGRPLAEGGFEADCRRLHVERGLPVELWSAGELRRRFPALAAPDAVEAHFNPRGGWVDASAAVAGLLDRARRSGVDVRPGTRAAGWIEEAGGRVAGVRLGDGGALPASHVVVAAGAWTAALLPELASTLRPTAQTVLHFGVDPSADSAGLRGLPVWCADIARTGWYGFPADAAGRFKVGHHGRGRALPPEPEPPLEPGAEERFRAFLRRSIPAASGAPLRLQRTCFYTDTPEADFRIDRHPERPGLTVAAGGSGHGFKFAPLLGAWIADAVEGRPRRPGAERFRWRGADPAAERRERARSLD